MKTILLFIPHFVYTSDLLKTGYISYLATKYKVVVLSPAFSAKGGSLPTGQAGASGGKTTDYYQHPNIIYRTWDLHRPELHTFFSKNIRIPFIREFNHLAYYHQRGYAFKTFRRKVLRLIGWMLPASFVSADWITAWEKRRTKSLPEFDALVSEFSPSLVVVCTPGFSDVEAEVILLARNKELRTVAINFSWDNLTTNAQQIRKTDYLIAWNHVIEREALTLHHYPAQNVFVSGVMRFDHHFDSERKALKQPSISREEFLKSKGLDPALKTIFFTTVPQHTYVFQREFIASYKKLTDSGAIPRTNLFVRIHPGDSLDNYKEFMGLPNYHIELPGHEIDRRGDQRRKIEMNEADYDNLRHSFYFSDINVNFCSSISLEACIYQKPIVNLAYNNTAFIYDRDHYQPILKAGAAWLVHDESELLQALKSYLENPALHVEGRKKVFDDYIVFSDGLAYKRNVDFLDQIVGRK